MKRKETIYKTILNIIILVFVLIALYPLILMIFGSLKTSEELSANPAGFPKAATLMNYFKLFTASGSMIIRSLGNSVFIAVVTTVLTLLFASMAAYAFAKCKFKGNKILFGMLLATMMVPMELTMPPLYIMFSKVKMLNSYSVQILPFVANVFALFMMKQFMAGIPDEIIEAARIDGSGHWKIYSRIIVPCSAPVMSALGILVFLGRWGEYLWPSMMISKAEYSPIMQILPILSDGSGNMRSIPWEIILSGCAVVTIPVIIVFFIFQDKFMSSATLGAVKG